MFKVCPFSISPCGKRIKVRRRKLQDKLQSIGPTAYLGFTDQKGPSRSPATDPHEYCTFKKNVVCAQRTTTTELLCQETFPHLTYLLRDSLTGFPVGKTFTLIACI